MLWKPADLLLVSTYLIVGVLVHGGRTQRMTSSGVVAVARLYWEAVNESGFDQFQCGLIE